MIIDAENVVLFIHPKNNAAHHPILDDLTLRMQFSLDECDSRGVVNGNGSFSPGLGYMGVHHCRCGAASESSDFELTLSDEKTHIYTNWLAAHYLAYHRSVIPKAALELVAKLPPAPKDYLPENLPEPNPKFWDAVGQKISL